MRSILTYNHWKIGLPGRIIWEAEVGAQKRNLVGTSSFVCWPKIFPRPISKRKCIFLPTSTSQRSPSKSCSFIFVPSRLSAASARSLSWQQQRILGSAEAGTGNAAADYEAREVNFRLHKYSMRMEMGLLRVPDESGCKGLLQRRRKYLAVRYRHMSLYMAVTAA